jgi:hypothetical protein
VLDRLSDEAVVQLLLSRLPEPESDPGGGQVLLALSPLLAVLEYQGGGSSVLQDARWGHGMPVVSCGVLWCACLCAQRALLCVIRLLPAHRTAPHLTLPTTLPLVIQGLGRRHRRTVHRQ